MERVLANRLKEHGGETIRLKGWVHNFRAMGAIGFLIVRDRSGLAQVIVEDKKVAKELAHLFPGTVVTVDGKVSLNEKAALGAEIVEPKVTVDVEVKSPPPVEYFKPEIPSDLEFILDHRTLSLRNQKIQAVFRIQAEMVAAFGHFMREEVDAVEYFGPNIIGASSEGGAEFFQVDYFGYNAALAQSSQLYKQIMVGVNERVFGVLPFFRAEPSHTPRHLAEGRQFEFEMGFFDHWHEVLDVQENCLKHMHAHIQKECAGELKIVGCELVKLPQDVAIPRITFKRAQELLFERTGQDERNEPDLSPAAEKELCRYALENHGTDFIFITDWLAEKRPFYSFVNGELTHTFDLLCGGTEITSGGQRCHTLEAMVAGIKAKEMDPADFADYLSIFEFGMPPHGGFGMGLERLTMTFLGLKNIREASLFPSDPKRVAGNKLKANIVFGGENIKGEILHHFEKNLMEFEHLTHDETPVSSEETAKIRGTSNEDGIKALILRGKKSKKNVQVNIPAHCKLDMKAVAAVVGEKCEFEDPAVIEERFGLLIGGVPPFGNLLNLDTYYDEAILSRDKSVFNCGLRTESIICKPQDLVKLVDPQMGKFVKE